MVSIRIPMPNVLQQLGGGLVLLYPCSPGIELPEYPAIRKRSTQKGLLVICGTESTGPVTQFGTNTPERILLWISTMANNPKKRVSTSLELGPRKRPWVLSSFSRAGSLMPHLRAQADPLVHHGRHFGRTVFAFANIHALLLAGLGSPDNEAPETQQ